MLPSHNDIILLNELTLVMAAIFDLDAILEFQPNWYSAILK